MHWPILKEKKTRTGGQGKFKKNLLFISKVMFVLWCSFSLRFIILVLSSVWVFIHFIIQSQIFLMILWISEVFHISQAKVMYIVNINKLV